MNGEITLDSLIQMVSEKDDQNQLTKSASADAKTELEQVLTNTQSGETTGMNKQAQEAGQSLAATILAGLQKQAENNVIAETDKMVAADDKKVQETPVAGKTVTETAKALMERAATEGGAEVPEKVVAEAKAEGAAQLAGQEPIESNLDKQASEVVSALVSDGVPFDEAVELVKQAQAEMAADLEKSAAVATLMDNGIDFSQAVELVKQATTTEYSDMDKQAALDQLVSEGFPFEDALSAIQEICG